VPQQEADKLIYRDFTVNGGICHEFNAEFSSTNYKLGAALRW
jgi:hypothetical protein